MVRGGIIGIPWKQGREIREEAEGYWIEKRPVISDQTRIRRAEIIKNVRKSRGVSVSKLTGVLKRETITKR